MMTDIMLQVYVLGVGAVIGSFLNVLIYRLPKNLKFVTGRSHCPQCGKLIRWYDNIPVISFLILRGKCRECHHGISWRYPLVELLTAAFFLLAFRIYGFSPQTVIVSVFFCLLLGVTVIDFQFYIIPDKITIAGMILGLAASFVSPTVRPLDAVIGMIAGGASLYLLAVVGDFLFKKESLGGGDIKLAAMLGAFLGWKSIILVFFGAAVLGLAYALIYMLFSRKMRQDRMIPFGPFLSMAALIALFFGNYLINLYVERVLALQ
jgi:leader peptidase (prepilin peptidase) / N-methyltransferase